MESHEKGFIKMIPMIPHHLFVSHGGLLDSGLGKNLVEPYVTSKETGLDAYNYVLGYC